MMQAVRIQNGSVVGTIVESEGGRVSCTRARQLLRLLCVGRVLARHRYPVHAEEIQRIVNDESGERWCLRSIFRDLQVLELVHFAERVQRGLWRHYDDHPLVTSEPALQRLCEITVAAEDV